MNIRKGNLIKLIKIAEIFEPEKNIKQEKTENI